MEGLALMVPIIVVMIPLFIVVSRSDIGQAIADAIRHNSGANKGAGARRELEQMRADMDQVRLELDDVHGQLLEAHERLDFAERMLTKSPETGNLPGAQ